MNEPCMNCGQPGAHFVPPSLGEEGFFYCDPSKDSYFIRSRKFVKSRVGHSRTASCGCGWNGRIHGDYCPEHGFHATMHEERLKPERIFLDYSPLPLSIVFVNRDTVQMYKPMPKGWHKASPNVRCEHETVTLHRYKYLIEESGGLSGTWHWMKQVSQGWHETSKTLFIYKSDEDGQVYKKWASNGVRML